MHWRPHSTDDSAPLLFCLLLHNHLAIFVSLCTPISTLPHFHFEISLGQGQVSFGVLPSSSALSALPLINTSSGVTAVSWSWLGSVLATTATRSSAVTLPSLLTTRSAGGMAAQTAELQVALGLSLSPAAEPFPQNVVDIRSEQATLLRCGSC